MSGRGKKERLMDAKGREILRNGGLRVTANLLGKEKRT